MSTLLALLMIVTLAAVPSSAATIALSKTSVSLTKGYSTTLSVTGTSNTVTWSTGNKAVATVTSKGKVVGKGVGSTYIYAKVSGKTLKCKVTVVAGKIAVGKSEVNLDVGKTTTVKIKAIGTHTISVSSSDKSVVTASWNGAKFDGNYITLTLKAVGAGSAKVKVYAKNYPTTIYKTINVTVDGAEISDDDTSSTSGQILTSVSSVTVDEGASSSFNVYVDSSKSAYLKVSSVSTAVATASLTSSNNGTATVTVTGVKAGTTTVKVYLSNNSATSVNIPVTVKTSSTYYNIVSTYPTKLTSTDQVVEIRISNNSVKYMLVPENYDEAYTNTLIAKSLGTYSYYAIYDSQPVKKTTKDQIIQKTVTNTLGVSAVRYELVPDGYDTAKAATAFAKYAGLYEYYVVYSEKPTKLVYSDEILWWDIDLYNSSTGKVESTTRYMLVPFNYDSIKSDLAKAEDEAVNQTSKTYSVLTTIPSSYDSSVYELIRWYNSTAGAYRYMLVPRTNCDFVKRNDLVQQDTGVYCYYVAYSVMPNVIESDTLAVYPCRVVTPDGTSSYTAYVLYNPTDISYTDKINKALSTSGDYVGTAVVVY
jgi:hypothetical protein